MDARDGAALRIGELAGRTGLTVKAIRFYERLGLLDAPRRAPNGYRVYGPAAEGQLQFIRRGKLLGLSLEEIKRLFDNSQERRIRGAAGAGNRAAG